MNRRWTVFVAAVAGTLVLAVAAGLGADRLVSGGPAPQLHSVPASTLASEGITLSAATTPPFCGIVDASKQGALVARAGCPISQAQAQADATGGAGSVKEAVLARVTSRRIAGGLQARLSWLLVVTGAGVALPTIACGQAGPAATVPACPMPLIRVYGTRLTVVDALTGEVLAVLPAGGALTVPITVPGSGSGVSPVGRGPIALPQPRYTLPPPVDKA